MPALDQGQRAGDELLGWERDRKDVIRTTLECVELRSHSSARREDDYRHRPIGNVLVDELRAALVIEVELDDGQVRAPGPHPVDGFCERPRPLSLVLSVIQQHVHEIGEQVVADRDQAPRRALLVRGHECLS